MDALLTSTAAAVATIAARQEGECMAAVLALGDGAVVSHRSAAILHRMLERSRAPIHVTVPGDGGRARRKRVVVHRSCTMRLEHITVMDGVPATTTERTLHDLRRSPDRAEYRRALRQAEYRQLPTGALSDGARSGLEVEFIAFCRRHRLPEPEINRTIGPFTVDFLWRERRVVVETDTFRTHGGQVAVEEDRARDAWLRARGYAVVRVTDRRLAKEPEPVAEELRVILAGAA